MLDRTTPRPVRLALYALYDAATIVRDVLASPAKRESYGRLLNLPKFGVLEKGACYRSAEPRTAAHADHIRRLGIRTILCVRGGGPSPFTVRLAREQNIELRVFDLGPDHDYDVWALRAAVLAALDPANHPVLVHCDGGRHRAGMISALVRHRQGWAVRDILDEYWRFAQPSPFADNIELISRCICEGMVARLGRESRPERQLPRLSWPGDPRQPPADSALQPSVARAA